MNLFSSLMRANLKRLTKYIPSVLISVSIVLVICTFAGAILSSGIYEEKSREKLCVAYYIPAEDNDRYTSLALDMLQEIDSINELATLVRVPEINDGYHMLQSNEAMYFIIVPENFIAGVLDSTNPHVDIVVKDNASIDAYITNELFLSLASYLGIAQAAVYSALDVSRAMGFSQEQVTEIQTSVNLTFLDRALNKSQFIQERTATTEGSYSLKQHYMASAVMISLFFMGFALMPFMQGYNNGMSNKLFASGIHGAHIFVQNFLCMTLSMLIAYVPCHFAIGIYMKHICLTTLFYMVPAAVIMALMLALAGTITKNPFTGNMLLFVTVLIIAYVGGGILPDAFLPKAVNQISDFMPGKYLISWISHSLFGGGYEL
ncbi:MAG: ABC transporter permease [Clostridium sp.]|nr:ABC transporter permease [Clostridium sp.]MCM1398127.1 ABC transporter permease [Clostridium sp.]MCM1460871.1 ABC transporter permease [Bacteroides sp.]